MAKNQDYKSWEIFCNTQKWGKHINRLASQHSYEWLFVRKSPRLGPFRHFPSKYRACIHLWTRTPLDSKGEGQTAQKNSPIKIGLLKKHTPNEKVAPRSQQGQ
ncbi:hypothetical protein DRW41_08050 [Neobacillus piezotolerans]|uniref:Uncharacterized protein n=1 Tax=Neobacillus piezotolerans TaxID=2259171 RepID=A0A3D8GUP7_9BACI|nr:hypothetical protein DRW41_08050 [Neobacillus piezotolerans]